MIPSDILAALATLIDGMAQPDFNFNHGPVDVGDPDEWVYPQTFFEGGDNAADNNPGLVGKHSFSWPLVLRALVPIGAGRIEAEVSKYHNDIVKLLDANAETTLKAAGLLRYEITSSTWRPRLVAAAPAEVRITLNLIWRQSRANPSST